MPECSAVIAPYEVMENDWTDDPQIKVVREGESNPHALAGAGSWSSASAVPPLAVVESLTSVDGGREGRKQVTDGGVRRYVRMMRALPPLGESDGLMPVSPPHLVPNAEFTHRHRISPLERGSQPD